MLGGRDLWKSGKMWAVYCGFESAVGRGLDYTCSAPQPPSASLMFCGGSIEGTNSRTAYAMPVKPIKDPKTFSQTASPRRIDPVKM